MYELKQMEKGLREMAEQLYKINQKADNASVKKQKHIAKEVMGKLKTLDPHTILAGGSPRDWYLGKAGNDLDFYIYKPELTLKYLAVLEAMGFEGVRSLSGEAGSYDANFLDEVYECVYNGQTLQFMFTTEPATIDKLNLEFGAATSKCYWDGDRLLPSNEFLLSLKTKVNYFIKPHEKSPFNLKTIDKFPDFVIRGRSQLMYDLFKFSSQNDLRDLYEV